MQIVTMIKTFTWCL